MLFFTLLTSVLATVVSAHMEMSYPPPFRSTHNPYATTIDYSMTSPLQASGSDFPCKGYQSDLSTKAGTPVVSWAAGGSYNFSIVGGASHDGGSCQASLSYDKGKTFTVIHSYIGNCPLVPSFDFTIPSDAPAGQQVLFAWTWFNKVGNREMYMNCASVDITGGSSSKRDSVAFSSRPTIFVANVGNGCTTIETTDLQFPSPGPSSDVTRDTSTPGGVTGTCKAVDGNGGGSASASAASGASSGSSSGSSPASSVAASSPANGDSGSASASPSGFMTVASSPVSAPTSAGSGTSPASPSSGVSSSSLTATSDGQCGGSQTCLGYTYGSCCSQWGWCGNTTAHCGTGCQSSFGTCGSSNPMAGNTTQHESTSGYASAAQQSSGLSTPSAPLVSTLVAVTTTIFLTSTMAGSSSPSSGVQVPASVAASSVAASVGFQNGPSSFKTVYTSSSFFSVPSTILIVPVTTGKSASP